MVLRGGLLLVVRRRGAEVFDSPGGSTGPGETTEQALARELAEETGLLLRSSQPFGVFSGQVETFLAEADGVASPNGEIEEIAWIDDAYRDDGIELGSVFDDLIVPELRARGLLRRRTTVTGSQPGQQVVLAVDLDGTTVFDGDRPGPRVAKVLEDLIDRPDVRLVIATSRAPRSVRELLGPVARRADLLCCNGALYASGETLSRYAELPFTPLRAMVSTLLVERTPFYLEYGDRFAVSGDGFGWMDFPDRQRLPADPVLTGVVKLVVDAPEPPWWAAQLRELAGPAIELCPHVDGLIDVTPSGVTKAAGLERLIGANAGPLVVFGKDFNDQDLLGHADMALVVGDGLPGVERAGHIQRVAARDAAVAMALRQAVGALSWH